MMCLRRIVIPLAYKNHIRILTGTAIGNHLQTSTACRPQISSITTLEIQNDQTTVATNKVCKNQQGEYHFLRKSE